MFSLFKLDLIAVFIHANFKYYRNKYSYPASLIYGHVLNSTKNFHFHQFKFKPSLLNDGDDDAFSLPP